MKRSSTLTVCACALLAGGVLLAVRASRAQKPTPILDWRLRFEPGQEIRVRRETYTSGAVHFGEREIAMKNSLSLLYSLQVLAIEPDGTARARLKLLSSGFDGDTGQTFYSPFSSIMKTSADEVLSPYRLAAKSSLELSISPRGEVDWKGENFEEHRNEKRHQAIARRGPNALDEIAAELTLYNLAESLRLLLASLPQEPILPGQHWSRSVQSHPTRATQTYEIDGVLSGVTGTRATLGSNARWLPRPRRADDEVQQAGITRRSSGHIQLDTATGWPLRAEENITVSLDDDPAHKDPQTKITSHSKQHIVTTITLGKATK